MSKRNLEIYFAGSLPKAITGKTHGAPLKKHYETISFFRDSREIILKKVEKYAKKWNYKIVLITNDIHSHREPDLTSRTSLDATFYRSMQNL